MKLTNSICPLCQSTKSEQMDVYSAILNLTSNSESCVVHCENCGVYYLWPNISDNLISELYSKSYFTGVSECDGNLRIPSSNNDYESGVAVGRQGKFRETVKTLLKHVPNAINILDIGAATGDFLAIAQEYGLSVSGIELSSYASAKAKEKYGFEFHQTGIADYKGDEKYDLIHMNHVFEHFSSPHQALERLGKLLKPGGVIYVEVPFQFNFFEMIKFRLTGQRKDFDVSSIHHPIFYRPKTLMKVFKDHGFKCHSMRVFSWSRYPAFGLIGQVKRFVWLVASLMGEGTMIEAIFEREH